MSDYFFSAGQSIGDTLVATPVARSLKQLEPDANITWYTFENTRTLLKYIPEITNLITVDDISPNTVKTPLVVLHGLYLNQYQLAKSVASIGHLVDCCYVIADSLLSKTLPRYRQPYMVIPEVLEEEIPKWLLDLVVGGTKFITTQSQVGGDISCTRNIPPQIVSSALRAFNHVHNDVPIVQIGGSNHWYLSEQQWGAYDLRGVPQSVGAWAIKHSSLFVGPTSGPCLEADAFGVPIVLFAAPSDPPQFFGPLVSKTWVLPDRYRLTSQTILNTLLQVWPTL